MDVTEEKEKLEKIADVYDPEDDWEEAKIIQMAAQLIGDHARDKKLALELGTSTGFMTESLGRIFDRMVCVDGSERNIENARERLAKAGVGGVEFERDLFESFEPRERFPNIVMAHVLEHVENPIGILTKYKNHLARNGIIHVAVPNAASLNRRIGMMLGMMEKIDQLGPKDHMIGHRRLYTYDLLMEHIEAAGLEVLDCKGIFLKPLSKGQMAHWKDELIDAFFAIGLEIPAYSMDIYLMAGLGEK